MNGLLSFCKDRRILTGVHSRLNAFMKKLQIIEAQFFHTASVFLPKNETAQKEKYLLIYFIVFLSAT